MSWSFNAIGRPAAVAAKARAEAQETRCAEPEEGIRKATLEIIATIADHTTAAHAVQVEASGSQYVANSIPQTNDLRVKVTPVYGLLE